MQRFLKVLDFILFKDVFLGRRAFYVFVTVLFVALVISFTWYAGTWTHKSEPCMNCVKYYIMGSVPKKWIDENEFQRLKNEGEIVAEKRYDDEGREIESTSYQSKEMCLNIVYEYKEDKKRIVSKKCGEICKTEIARYKNKPELKAYYAVRDIFVKKLPAICPDNFDAVHIPSYIEKKDCVSLSSKEIPGTKQKGPWAKDKAVYSVIIDHYMFYVLEETFEVLCFIELGDMERYPKFLSTAETTSDSENP